MKPMMKLFNTNKFLRLTVVLLPLVFLAIFSIKIVQAAVVLITAEKIGVIESDLDENGVASPGDILKYTVTIFNKGDINATDVVFNDDLDPNTTLIPGSIVHSPIAVPDVYPQTVLGNVRVDSSRIPFNVISNDNPGNPVITEITLDSPTSTRGGNVTMVTSGPNMGQFTYDPPPGYEGTDTFTYTLTNSVGSTKATVTLTISKMVWFVNNNATVCTTLVDGCGRLSKPFSSLASLVAINNGTGNNPAANDVIFVYESNTSYAGAITLLEGQKLVGQDAGDSLANFLSVIPATSSDPLPTMNPSVPYTTLSNTVTLHNKVTVRGLKINTTNSTGITDPSVTISEVFISEVSVNSSGGTGIQFSNNSGTFNFVSLTASNGANGIVLENLSSTSSFTLPSGSITNTSSDAIRLNNVQNVTLSNINITDAAKNTTNPACNFTSISSVCESGVEIIGSNNISLSNMVINHNNLGMQGIVAQNTSNLILKNSQIMNVGDSDNESGILLNNLSGNILLEDITITNPKEFGIRIYQTTGTLAGVLRRVKIQNNNGIYGEDGLSLRVEGGSSTFLVDDSDFLNTGGSGVAASVQGTTAVLNLTLQNSTWSENLHLPHAVSFTTAASGIGNVTIKNNLFSGCSTPTQCFGVIDLDTSDSSSLNAIINGNTSTNSGDGTGIEFIVNDYAIGKANITNNSFTIRPDRVGMNFMARSVTSPGSTGHLDLTLSGNTINGVSSTNPYVFPGMNFQSGSSTGSHAQTLCVNLASPAGGNTINGINTDAYQLRQRTGTTFQLQGLTGSGTDAINVENFVTSNNPAGTLSGSTYVFPAGATTIVNYTSSICQTPVSTTLPATSDSEFAISESTDQNSEQQVDISILQDFNNPPDSSAFADEPSSLMRTKAVTSNPIPEVSLGILPPGSSVIIQYQVTINDPLFPTNASQIVNQGRISSSSIEWDVFTDDPTVSGISDSTVILLPKPDLKATKTNTVSGSVTLPSPWSWKIRVENSGNFQAEFAESNTILIDNLPETGLTYANVLISPVDMDTKIDCSIVSNTLNCLATEDLEIATTEYFDVTFDVTPSIAGSYVNPISTGICSVDPNSVLLELDSENNSCSDTVAVNTAPLITSADTANFVYNTSESFTIQTTAGYPTDTVISVVGSLPDGVTFTDLGNGSATIAGTPTTTGSFDLTIKATNSATLESSQSFTLNVNLAPVFTSSTSATFITGIVGTFSITTSGYPIPAITYTSIPELPTSLTLTDNSNGTATLSGTPLVKDAGLYTIKLTAKNGISPDATQTLSLMIGQQPAITSVNNTTLLAGSTIAFTFTTSGYPIPTLSYTGTLPSGLNFKDNLDGTASLSGIPAEGSGNQYLLELKAANGISPDATQTFTLTIQEAPTFTSGTTTSFSNGTSGIFTITTTGYPTTAITYSSVPELPSSMILTDNGDGTATLSGTPAPGDGGVYVLSLVGSNGVSPDANQLLTVSIGDGPVITSASSDTFVVGSSGSFTITTTGYPSPAISYTGTLPSGVSFTDNLDGIANLNGIPASGTGGLYALFLKASNDVPPDATQDFTLTVQEAPLFTSANSANFTVESAGTFSITTSGYPSAAITFISDPALPASLTIIDNGDGTATLSGTPGSGDGGSYAITLTANNGVNPLATQSLTLKIGQQPAITSLDNTTFVVGSSDSFTVTSSGFPYPAFSFSGSLPSDISLTDNLDGTATLGGTPADGTGGVFQFTITADNDIPPQAEQLFTLTVNEAPEITSNDHTNFSVNAAGEFTITTNGYPLASINYSSVPDLPTSITLVDNDDGTGTLSGTPQAGDGGVYLISLTADNGIDPDATQSLTLSIGESPVITSANTVTFVESNPGSFSITTSGTPLPTISYSGELPDGVTLVDQRDGTATLSGTPAATSTNTYPITIKATNGVGIDASQDFTLVVQSSAGVASINSMEDSGDGLLEENERTNVAITQLLVTFNHPMDHQSAMDPAKYILQKDGSAITIDLVLYNQLEQTTTLHLNAGIALPDGEYKLIVSGQILDELGYPIGSEFVRNFSVDTKSIEIVPFGFTLADGTILKEGIKLTRAIQSLRVTFTEDASNPSGDIEPEDVTNPKNYLLVQAGTNDKFETMSCESGVVDDDIQIPVGPIVYDNNNGDGPFIASIKLNNGKTLPNGLYRLFICGSTSISDLAGNKLNDGNDETLNFSVQMLSAVESLPSTGFAPGRFTDLVEQPFDFVYQSMGDLWLELPTQGIKASITGVPWLGDEWDLTWLNQQVGWLEGTAYPTWNGNTVLTAHAYRADGLPGPFAYLKSLKFGDTVIIHYQGLKYSYAVRSRTIVSPGNTSLLSRTEKNDWLTLITCQQFDESTQTYLYRTVVRAVLIKVEDEN